MEETIQKSLKDVLDMESLSGNEALFLEMSGASGSEKEIADAWIMSMYRHGVFLPECFRRQIMDIIRKNRSRAA